MCGSPNTKKKDVDGSREIMAKVTQERDQPRAQSEKQLWELGKQLTLMFQLDRDAKQWRPSWSKMAKKEIELFKSKEQVREKMAC